MAAQVKSFHLDSSHTKSTSKNTSLKASKMQNMPSERGQELLKALIRKKASDKGNVMSVIESKGFSESKKTCISSGEELMKVVSKGTEKLNIKESKNKSGTNKKMCFCSPTTHEGSFRCHLHRISAPKKSSSNEKNVSNLRLKSKRTHGIVEFKPQLSRFGRTASAEMGPHDSLIQLPEVESA